MRYSSIYLTLFLSTLVTFQSLAQDPVFNQNDNLKTYNNPAFIGTDKSASFDLTYRNQWPQISGNYISTVFSANQYLGKGNGVSLLYLNDKAGQVLTTNRIGLGYSKQFSISENHNLSIGMQAMYFNKTLDWGKLTFGDQIDPRVGFIYQTSQSNADGTVKGLDFNWGALYHNKFIFAGVAVHHLFEPNEGIISSSKLDRKYSFQMGGKINLNEVTFIPYIQGNNQGTFNGLISSLKTRYKSIELDLGYALNNGPTGGLGLRFETWNLGYNMSVNTSQLSSSNISVHEVRIGFQPSLFNKTNESYFDF